MAISTEEMRARQQAAQGDEVKIGQAIQEVTDRAQLLIREEIELAKAEITAKVTQLIKGAVVGVAAGIFIVVALLFVLHGFAWLAWDLLFAPGDDVFWGYLIVAGVLFLMGALAGFLASRAFKRGAPPTPDLAIAEAKRIQDTVKSEHPERTI
jgi:Putative Actinobacterial Holin-X, holin superfamily III